MESKDKGNRRVLLFGLDKAYRKNDLEEALQTLDLLKGSYCEDEAGMGKIPLKRYLQVLSICTTINDTKQLARLSEEIRRVHGDQSFFAAASDLLIKFYAAHDLEKALKLHREMKSRGLKLKRRSYGPIIAACCTKKDKGNALLLYKEAKARGIGLTSGDLTALISLFDELSLDKEMNTLLSYVCESFTVVPAELRAAIRLWFSKRSYDVISGLASGLDGSLCDSKGRKEIVQLPDQKLPNNVIDEFLDQILTAQILKQKSRRKEKAVKKAVRKFVYRLSREGGAEVWIDGANVGHFEMGGSFSYQQVDSVYWHFVRAGFRTRLVLHHSRVHGLPPNSSEEKIVRRWTTDSALYITPNGVNDDAFWIYGALWSSKTQKNVHIVTNDLGRDHQYRFGHDPRFFNFMQAHVIRFRVKDFDAERWRRMSLTPYAETESPTKIIYKPIATRKNPTRKKKSKLFTPTKVDNQQTVEYSPYSRVVTPNQFFAANNRHKSTRLFTPISHTRGRVQAYAPGRYMTPVKTQPVPLRSQPVPYFKLKHFIAPNVLPLEYHYPFHYVIAAQPVQHYNGEAWVFPYLACGKDGDQKDLFKSESGDIPPTPATVAKRVSWMMVTRKTR